MGSVSGFTRASRARLRGASIASSICATTLERSRTLPWLSAIPGFSLPGAPYRSSFIVFSLSPPRRRGSNLQAHPAVDEHRLAGHERRLVGHKINESLGDFLGGGQAPHRLAGDEVLARLHRVGEGVDAI